MVLKDRITYQLFSMAKKQARRQTRSNNRTTTSALGEVVQHVPNDLPYGTSDGTVITPEVARELAEWRLRLIPNVVAARVWNQLFSADDRARLGGDLSVAWTAQGTMAMYMRARHVTYERAMLEIAWGLAQIHEADYERLLRAIGGQDAGRLVPKWDRERLLLHLGDRVIKTVRSRRVARRVCLVLDAFEEVHWQPRIDDPLPGGTDHQRLREVVRSLNRGLKAIRFAADGTGAGIIWRFS